MIKARISINIFPRNNSCFPDIALSDSKRKTYQALPIYRITRHWIYTVELQWLEHLWDHENLFETGVVRANEG